MWFVLRSESDRGWRRRERIAGWLCQTSWFSRTRVEIHIVTWSKQCGKDGARSFTAVW